VRVGGWARCLAATAASILKLYAARCDALACIYCSHVATPLPPHSSHTALLRHNHLAVPPEVAAYLDKLSKLQSILSGKTPVSLYLDFLYRQVGQMCSA
jgi:hypothetical protein